MKSASLSISKNKSRSLSATELVKSFGLRTTDTRVWIIELLQSQSSQLTAQEVYDAILNQGPKKVLNLTTVYRCLDQLEKFGLVESELRSDRTKQYLWKENRKHEHFVVCKKCSDAKLLPGCEMGAIHSLVKKMGFSDVTHRLELFGLCAKCS